MDDIRPADEHDDELGPAGDTNGGHDAGGGEPETPPDELRKRLDDLERELAKTRAERDEFKASMYSLLEQIFPYTPPTEAEIHDMMYGPRGQPILEIVEEYEKRYLNGET